MFAGKNKSSDKSEICELPDLLVARSKKVLKAQKVQKDDKSVEKTEAGRDELLEEVIQEVNIWSSYPDALSRMKLKQVGELSIKARAMWQHIQNGLADGVVAKTRQFGEELPILAAKAASGPGLECPSTLVRKRKTLCK